MINGKPTADYERILADNGMPVTEEQARAEFEAIVKDEGLSPTHPACRRSGD